MDKMSAWVDQGNSYSGYSFATNTQIVRQETSMIQCDSSLSKFGDCKIESVSKGEFFNSMIEKLSNSRDFSN